MGRAPCCEKKGVKKGSWTHQEDQVLIDFIRSNGHDNWRVLPKLAGLRRCGKSCRLRWLNYLKPDIKRGNFSKEEEDDIIKLHQLHGNRWSVIASRLPGRTDNEIKNVWHTYIKKRVSNPSGTDSSSDSGGENVSSLSTSGTESSSKLGGILELMKEEQAESVWFPGMDESFWWDTCMAESDFLMKIESSSLPEPSCDMGFWNDLFTAGTLPLDYPDFN